MPSTFLQRLLCTKGVFGLGRDEQGGCNDFCEQGRAGTYTIHEGLGPQGEDEEGTLYMGNLATVSPTVWSGASER